MVFSVIYAAMITGIMCLCTLFPSIQYACKVDYLPLPVLLILGLVLIFFFPIQRETHLSKMGLVTIAVLFLLLQIVLVRNYYFYTNWDVNVLIQATNKLTHRVAVTEYDKTYFSRYPNNMFLVAIFTSIQRLLHFFGFHSHEYAALLVIQCIVSCISGLLTAAVIQRLYCNSTLTLLGYSLYILLVGLSPWVSIPYSDSFGLLFPILILYLYCLKDTVRHSYYCHMAIGFLLVTGYHIKPQVVIVGIAIICVEALKKVRGSNKMEQPAKKIFGWLLAGIMLAVVLIQGIISEMPVELNKEAAFGPTHFLMMGLNQERMGIYSSEDVSFSASFALKEARNQANWRESKKRFKEMGIVGTAKHLVRKTLTNYNDGTFAWGMEGNFFREVLPERENSICSLVRGLYYRGEQIEAGKYYVVWSNFEQLMWMTILALSIGTVLQKSSFIHVIQLSLIGLTLFELIFEARARYLYIYSPFYILLAISGVKSFLHRSSS